MELNRFFHALLPLLGMAAIALFQVNRAQAAACMPPPTPLCANAPSEETNHCQTLADYLAEFEQEVCSVEVADPSYRPSYAGVASLANGNSGPGLLTKGSLDRVTQEIDQLAAIGSSIIRLDIVYPLLTPAFHSYLATTQNNYTATAEQYLDFYRSVVAIARERGLKIHIEHSVMLPAFSWLNPAPYYSSIKTLGADGARERFRQERAEEATLLINELAPDYLTLLTEPNTENESFGPIEGTPLYSPAQWQAYVEYTINQLPDHRTRLGAGAGTWDAVEYMHRLASLPELDYIDLHIYPARSPYRNYLSEILKWSDLVRSIDPNKEITIGEAWLYKATAAEIAGGQPGQVELLGRDVYSYWEPLDSTFITLLDQAALAKQIEVLTPFWSRHFFAYLDYAETSTQSPLERMYNASVTSFAQLRAGALTGTGRTFRDLAFAARLLVINEFQPNHGPQTGPLAAQTVTLTGANFSLDSVPTLLFDDVVATSVEVLDAGTLRVVVPPGIGSVKVTVISADGRRASKVDGYSYDPPPTITNITPAQGPKDGGTLLVISGKEFMAQNPATRVLFGDWEAPTLTYIDPSTLQVVTPAGTGSVTVTLVNPDGQITQAARPFTYIAADDSEESTAAPTLHTVSPQQIPASGGVKVSIYGENFQPGATVHFGTTMGDPVTLINSTLIEVIAPQGQGEVSIRVTNPDGKEAYSPQPISFSMGDVGPGGQEDDDSGIDEGSDLAARIFLPALSRQ